MISFDDEIILDMNRIRPVLDRENIQQTLLVEQLNESYEMVNKYLHNRQQPRFEVLIDNTEISDMEIDKLIVSNK
jgi:hypothetical protein